MIAQWVHQMWRLGLRVAYQLLRIYWRLFQPREASVHVAVWWDEQILLIRHSYKPRLAVPGGRTKRGEALEDAAVRELREEVGIVVHPQDLTFARLVVSHEEKKEDQAHFFVVELPDEPHVTVDQREVIASVFLTREAAVNQDLTDPVRQFLSQIPNK